jgi:conflict system STAND superfamily ATPase
MTIPDSPYRGIHSFRYRDRALFFGRQESVSGLLVKVMLSRLTILFGESGTGKSSMLNAGLVPALEKEGLQAERLLIQPDGPIIVERMEGDTPGSFLPSIFAADAPTHPGTAVRIPCSIKRFLEIVRTSATNTYPVLVFDQFEQLFTLFDRSALPLQSAILGAIFDIINDDALRAKVVIAIREDFLAKLEVLAKGYPRVFDNRVLVKQLNAQSARNAIRSPFGPPNPFRSQLTEALAGIISADLEGESSTGLIHPTHLQIICSRLWDEYANTRKEIGPEEFKTLGGVPGIIGGYLESQLGGLDAVRKAQAVWCLGGLITESGTRDVVSEGKLQELLVKTGKMEGAALSATLEFLQKQRLVNVTPRRDTLYYEIASEYLIPPVRRELQVLRLEEEKRELTRKEREKTDRRLTEAKLREGARYKRLSRWLAGAVGFAIVAGVVAGMGWGTAQVALRAEEEQSLKALKARADADKARVAAEAARAEAEEARKRETAALQEKLALQERAREAGRAREEAVRRAREEEERRALTDGQIERLRSMRRALKEGEDLPKEQIELVFDSVANFLWSKGDDRELQRILNAADDLFPRWYGVDTTALSNLLTNWVDRETPWPLELHYSPAGQLDPLLLLYHWQSMARVIARDWGIPAPLRLKLVEDPTLPTYEFRVVTRPSEEDSKKAPPEARFRVQSEPGQYVVGDPGNDRHNQRLSKFLQEYGQGKVNLGSTRIRKTYYYVPKWTQPVWKVAGHSSFSREGLIALSAANSMFEKPELLITGESVRPILKRIAARHPKTVEEALAARGGLAGLAADLREIVARDRGLAHVEFLLDLLADFPDRTSDKAVDLALSAEDGFLDVFPAKLPGQRNRSTLEAAAVLESKARFQYVYDEVSGLPPLEQPVRVLVGSEIDKHLTRENKLAPEVEESLLMLRNEFNRRFGFVPPAVRFRVEETLRADEIRIEILNQTNSHADAQPIATTPDGALTTLIEQLKFRYVAARAWWLDADYVNRQLLAFPDNLRTWLLKRYTLTDLKMLLQAQIAPTAQEINAYGERRDEAGYRSIADDQTIQDLPWLLGSLVFLVNSKAETTDIDTTVGWFRRLQRSRLGAPVRLPEKGQTLELVQKGIDRLASGDIDGATGSFAAALAVDRPGAGEVFLSLYAEKVNPEVRIAQLEKTCTLPRLGRAANAVPPSVSTRYDLEELLTRSSVNLSADRRRTLELCRLWIYADAGHAGSAQAVISRLLSENVQKWRPEEEYVLAALMLRLHGNSMAEPSQMPEIRRLLSDSVQRFSPPDAERVFQELLDKYEGQLPLWHAKLLVSLAELQPTSFFIPLRLGGRLSSGDNVEEAEAALKLLEKAGDQIDPQKLEERDRWAAVISYFKAVAWQTSLKYGNRSAYLEIQKLAATINTREEKGWPSRDSVTLLLINAHLLADNLADATKASEEWLRRSPASHPARDNAIFVRLANLDVAGALRLARSERGIGDNQDEEVAYKIAALELLSGSEPYEASAKYFLEKTQHRYRDYVRLMLFWRLALEGRGNEARGLINERWKQIDTASWYERLAQGDVEVWREMLVGYYAGQVRGEQILSPVKDTSSLQASPLSSIGGMSFAELRGEAYFYDALLQEVSGDSATRRARSRRALEEVVRLRRVALYEYHMARYLLSMGGKN